MSEETPVNQISEKQTTANPYLMPGAILLAGILIAYAVFVTQGDTAQTPVGGNTLIEEEVLPITSEDHIYGPKDPDVYFIEYSDFRCGYCGLFHKTILETLAAYEGKVAWVYRHTPYQPGGKEAAIASECIAELAGEEAFWEYSDRVFKNQKSLSPQWSADTALDIGVDGEKYTECISSGRYDDLIAKQTTNMEGLGGKGTPFNVLLTKEGGVVKFSGYTPIENVTIFVNRALKSLE